MADVPDIMTKRLRGPRLASERRMASLIPPRQTMSTASLNVSEAGTGAWLLHASSTSKHSSAVAAWKQPSGRAKCTFISLITIRGGRLLKETKA